MLKVSKEKGRESGFLMNLIRDMLQEAAGTWTRRRKNHACACASLFTADVHLLSQVSLHNFPLSLIWCLMLKHWAVNKSRVFFSFFSILFPLHLIYKLSHCKEMTISTVNLFLHVILHSQTRFVSILYHRMGEKELGINHRDLISRIRGTVSEGWKECGKKAQFSVTCNLSLGMSRVYLCRQRSHPIPVWSRSPLSRLYGIADPCSARHDVPCITDRSGKRILPPDLIGNWYRVPWERSERGMSSIFSSPPTKWSMVWTEISEKQV